MVDAQRGLPVAAEAGGAPVRGGDQHRAVGHHALGVTRRSIAPGPSGGPRRAAPQQLGIVRIWDATEQERAGHPAGRASVIRSSRSSNRLGASGCAYGTVTSTRRRAAVDHRAQGLAHRRSSDDETQPARGRADDLGATCGIGVPTAGAVRCGAARPRRAEVAVAVVQCASNASAAARRSCRDPDAVTHHSRVPASGRRRGGSRRWRSRGASRQMRFPVPTATVASTISSLPCAASAPTPATRHSAAGGDQLPRGRRVAVGAVRVEHEADAKPALGRPNQRPPVRRTDLVDRRVDAAPRTAQRAASAPCRLRPDRARTSARSRRERAR